jgi:DNA repair exonuclease SbcCD ATPase subunit
MIVFKNVKWKNFLSTGNHWTEIKLNESHGTIIIGSNGAGKSTVLDALTFSLFGKPYRKINKPQLVNSVNEKDCVVEIEFDIKGKEYKIVRGIKPNKFEIWIDGKMQDQSSSAVDQQKKLEQQILKLNYKSFTQIVILGSAGFTPFMQLTSSQRREVIEDILDIKIFSAMNSVVKDKMRENKERVRTLELKKETLIDKIQMQKDFIDELEKRGQKDIVGKQEKISTLQVSEDDLIKKNDDLSSDLSDVQNKLEQLSNPQNVIKKMNNIRVQLQTKVKSTEEERIFFDKNTVCPTCTQDIEEGFRLNRIAELNASVGKLETGLSELEEKLQEEESKQLRFIELTKEVSSLTHGISQNNVRISGLQRQCRDLESEIQKITEQLANRNSEHDKLRDFDEKLKTSYNELAEEKDKINLNEFVYSLLKDGGVKTKIIKKYLPLINQQVNRYLQMMEFYINFTLDEEFSETVQSPIHENFSYASFSEGEKMRIDLALLFTWREIAKYKNSTNTNLLVMDEVFDSSLDGMGTEEFLKIIRFVIRDANIFVISHKSELYDRFPNSIKFEKVKGFSQKVS